MGSHESDSITIAGAPPSSPPHHHHHHHRGGGGRTSTSKQPTFLHGELDVWIHEAKSLPNMDLASEHLRRCFNLLGSPCSKNHRRRRRASSSSAHHSIITSDPYVSVCLAGATVAQTRVIPNCENPLWDEHFLVPVAHPVLKVEFHVKDNDVLGAQLIGVVELPVEKITPGEKIDDWFPLVGHAGNCLKPYPELRVAIRFKPVGSGTGPGYGDGGGVANTYFPLRKGGMVTLYQDAHVPDGMLPEIVLDGGKVYRHEKCWEDMCHAMLEAHHLIYVVGWSIYHKVKLVREPTAARGLPSGGELTLGELLKYKSQEGVRVVMLIWDDKTSHDKFFFKTDGVMQTHDEETKKFFKHSTVHCVLAPRYPSNKLRYVFGVVQVVGTLFTHHQKCVILDTQASGNNRKITSFIGGLDLCDGRYDTPDHRLFRDLDTIFLNDFHNPTFPSNARSPRQPWHDLHCKIEGPAAHDILTNFEQRWRKAQKWRDFRLKKVTQGDALLKLDRISWILNPSTHGDKDVYVCDESDPERWHVQIFRSIDSGSVRGFPKAVGEAAAQNLVCGKNLKVDKSIHTAYIKAIRSAQHFIYIENQYFLGSSFCWPSYKNAGADNLVPMEIALKIASKINANERFSAYVVIPMWPEGSPTSAAVQEILFWQGQTMQMMYKIIANALEKAGLLEAYHPQDYLNFFCLGKREDKNQDCAGFLNPQTDWQAACQKYRRFMIYVHAKGMIVDDEYVVIGSANINQRSLDGSRDTEIAMGAYQPAHTWAAKQGHPRSQIYGYRMSLWAEHMEELEEAHKEPQSMRCMKNVNKVAKDNWKAFVAEERLPMKGHLMQYPIQVSRDGKVSALPGHESFPDVGGKVLGSPTTLPDTLTT
ncbi:unnamed protein product [Linum tenue]|uniref:Phospholipase D n=1 Tax=Linum tenue TaxID=586396 RepID=A0AAV0GSJ1_9ROSI|nr:unnamed protein product [Linum tenue]